MKNESATCPRCGSTAYKDDNAAGGMYVLAGLFFISGIVVLAAGVWPGTLIAFAIGAFFIYAGKKPSMKCPHCKKNFTA